MQLGLEQATCTEYRVGILGSLSWIGCHNSTWPGTGYMYRVQGGDFG